MSLVILKYPNDILRQESLPVDKVTPELQQLARDMYEVMKQNGGIGLSAPQVGKLIKLIVLDNNTPLYMFNPKILQKIGNVSFNEGCLSFPEQTREIKRSAEVKVQYRDLNGKVCYRHFKGLSARVILHEYDHLMGILFIDK